MRAHESEEASLKWFALLHALDRNEATEAMGKIFFGNQNSRGKNKKVIAIHKNGITEEFISSGEMGRKLGLNSSSIRNAIRENRTLTCGIKPVYKEDYENAN